MIMNNIQIFNSEQFGDVRVAGTSEQPLFCLADICKSLDIKNISDCRTRLKQDGVGTNEVIDSLGRKQMAIFITESNLYRCVFQSRRPDAEKFQDWVCEYVIPSIRKNGAYMTNDTLEKALSSPDFLIQLATKLKTEQAKNKLLECANQDKLKIIEKQAPKVLFADAVATSYKSCLIGELSKIICQNGIDIGERRLFQWLRDNGYLCAHGERYNQPTQRSMELGLFEIKKTTITKPNGTVLVSSTPKCTGKGQIYFVDKFLRKKSA
jgi:anti-repressor protein